MRVCRKANIRFCSRRSFELCEQSASCELFESYTMDHAELGLGSRFLVTEHTGQSKVVATSNAD